MATIETGIKYDLYKKEDNRFSFMGQTCTAKQNGDVLVFPAAPDGCEWVRDDGDSIPVGGSSFSIDEMNARNEVRTWGDSGFRNPRTGKEY
jgi:hypothetical protein